MTCKALSPACLENEGLLVLCVSAKKPSYEDTIKLDLKLHEMYKEVPPSLKTRLLSSSVTDEAHMVMWRLNIELMSQRSLCVLHRDHLSHHHSNPSFDYPRRTCTNAALQTLEHQVDLHFACQPGGRFCNDQWMLLSLILHDFPIDAMIISLDLYESHNNATRSSAENPDARAKIFDASRLSYEIWASRRETSRDARHASRICCHSVKAIKYFTWKWHDGDANTCEALGAART